jgi:hypothetical protein
MTPKRSGFASGLYFAGLILLVASLPLSVFMMSVSQFMIAGAWLIDGNISSKLRKFLKCKPALAISSVFLLHLIGLFFTTDFNYAFKDIRIKLPLLILPLIISTGPALSAFRFRMILVATITGVVISSFISMAVLAGFTFVPVNDIRDISIFISHIRLALLVCISVFASLWLAYYYKDRKPVILLMSFIIAWLIMFLFILESLTGIFVLFTTLIFFLIKLSLSTSKGYLKYFPVVIAVLLTSGIYFYINSINDKILAKENIKLTSLDSLTSSGRRYVHYVSEDYENGHHIWSYICEPELEQEWNQLSRLKYDGKDLRGQDLQHTLIRFLASKGLRKDSSGISKLTDEEINAIENGIANVDYQQYGSLSSRIHQVLWEINEYKKSGDASGHSVVQRLEFWRAALRIILDHPLTGVGTGDLPDAFTEEYDRMQSHLDEHWRLRSHNQFLSIAAALGIPAMMWFVFVLIYLAIIQARKKDYLYLAFALTAVLSMLTEDTLETQAGITFFTLFNCVFLFVNPQKRACDGI